MIGRRMTKNELTRTLNEAMTVSQLIEHLQGCDPEAPVLFTCNYGDYHRTMQALTIEQVDEFLSTDIEASAYSHSGMALIGDNEDAEYWCPECETERTSPTCPKCKVCCLTEDGTPAEQDDDESFPVVILR